MIADTIIISSTNVDLAEYRQTARNVCQELDMPVIAQEYESTDGENAAVNFSEMLVDRAKCYLGIIAWRYGCVPPGRDRSVTELEYDRAVNHPRGSIPRYMFILKEGTSWPENLMDLNRTQVANFRKRVCQELVCELFGDRFEFEFKVRKVLSKRRHDHLMQEIQKNLQFFRQAILDMHVKLDRSHRAIERIKRFKAMHDCLHTIQQDCVNVLYEQVLGPLAADTANFMIPAEYGETVCHVIDTFCVQKNKFMKLSVEGPKIRFVECCCSDLLKVDSKCDAVREQPSIHLLQKMASEIERILVAPFSQLNERLSEGISELDQDLPPVIEALEQALNHPLRQLGEDDEDVIRQGIAGIRSEYDRMRIEIRDHNAWQDLHEGFTKVDSASGIPEEYVATIRREWDDYRKRCCKLANPRKERGSRDATVLLEQMRAVSVAIATGTANDKLVEKFQFFRQAFDKEFYNVDNELKDHCDQLSAQANEILTVLLNAAQRGDLSGASHERVVSNS